MPSVRPIIFALFALASPAFAEADDHPARLEPGDFAIMSHDWLADSDEWVKAGPAVNRSCWQVLSVEGQVTKMELISGPYHPGWSDARLPVGHVDSFLGTNEFYLKTHPFSATADRELARMTFTTVQGCPLP